MKVVVRADSSLLIGSGHLSRCLTLADELSGRGAEVIFICRELDGNLTGLVEERGYRVLLLPAPHTAYAAGPEDLRHAPWLGVSWLVDAENTIQVLEGERPDWLVVDHYALDSRWEQRLRTVASRIMVIDDLADRPHDCDVLLDQNLYDDMYDRYRDLIPCTCKTFVGPKYALLRPEFHQARKKLRHRDGAVKRVLVFFGGVDSTDQTSKAVQALADIDGRCFDVDVVVGAGYRNKNQLKELCINQGFDFHCQVSNMAELMAAADLAVGAGGATTWERCYLGLPSIVLVLADNQRKATRDLAATGAILNLGDAEEVSSSGLKEVLTQLVGSSSRLASMSGAALQLMSEKGGLVTDFIYGGSHV